MESKEKEGEKDKGGDKGESNDDPQFIKDLLAVHDKYLAMVRTTKLFLLLYVRIFSS